MILTPESLPLDPMLELHNELKNVLEENATVIILFGQEDKMCSKLLKTKLNYHTAGYFIIAHNNELSDIDTPNKVFDQYELYKNQIDGRKFYIGCRFGWYGERQLMEKQVDLDCIDADDLFWTYSDGINKFILPLQGLGINLH
uniref:Uncharacterized protein n=1 Tax=Panagrolaimus superbus TaxID=310955 RepID=A0A914YP50_9BILA